MPKALTAGDFGFSDSDGNGLAAVIIDTVPGAGSLRLGGVVVTAGQSISAGDIGAGNLVFTPAANANGVGYASFTFRVRDDGGTDNGGIDTDGSANTLTVNITAVNDAPVLSGTSTLGYTENGAAAAINTALMLSDVDSPNLASASVSVTNFVAGQDVLAFANTANITGSFNATTGVLTLSGADTAANYQAALRSVTYASSSDSPTTTARDVTFVVNDGGALSGVVHSTVNITAVNDAPVLSGTSTLGYTENGAAAAINTALMLSDVDSPNLASASVSVTNFVAGQDVLAFANTANITGSFNATTGVLTLSGADTAANYQAALRSVTYASSSDSPTTTARDVTFVVNDGGALSGVVHSTVNITAVNDAPAGTDVGFSLIASTTKVFAPADFGFTDVDGNALSGVKIATLSAGGSLANNAVAVTAGQTVSVADIAGGKLIYTAPGSAGTATFGFQVQDNGGTANGGGDLDATANTVSLSIGGVNAAPRGADTTVTLLEDGSRTLTTADFGYVDPDGHALSAIAFPTLPSIGALALNGVALTAGQSVIAAEIVAGHLVFTPAANGNGAAYAQTSFQVQDDGGTANGGVDTDASANTLTFAVTSVNDAPSGTNNSASLVAAGTKVFAGADFGFTDTDGGSLAGVRIASLPVVGTLALNGVAVTAGQTVSAGDLSASRLVYTAPGAAGNPSFTFQVQDDGGTASVGVDLDPSVNTYAFIVSAPTPSGGGEPVTPSVITGGSGTAGDDTVQLDLASTGQSFDAGAGNDSVTIGAGNHTVSGGDGNDAVIITGNGSNTVFGGAGGDSVTAGGGGDVIQGNTGNDSLAGGAGGDIMYGGQNNDALQGNAGNDVLYGDKGNDTVLGGQGTDVIQGGQDNDYVIGDKGDDVVRGGQGNDSVSGGEGKDFVSGDLGDDTVSGGAGADLFHTWGGAGIDTVTDFSLADGDRVFLDPGTTYALAQVGADTVITMGGGGTMILTGVQLSSLAGDWIFGG